MTQVATAALQAIGLADAYPPNLHYPVYTCLRTSQLDNGCGHSGAFVWWVRCFLDRQSIAGNHTITPEFFRANLDLAPKRVRMFRQYMAIDPSTLACIPYIQRRLSVDIDTLISALKLNDEHTSIYTLNTFITNPLIAALVKHTLTMYATVQVAYGLSMLDIMNCIGFDKGYKLRIIGFRASQLRWSSKQCRNAAIKCVKACLSDGTDIKTKGNIISENGRNLWSHMSYHSSLGEKEVRSFMRAVIIKHKLLFDYLTHSTHINLESLCVLYPDIALILCGCNGKPARTLSRKLTIASTWTGLLLLDLLQIDSNTIIDPTPIDLVVSDPQFDTQSVCIEI